MQEIRERRSNTTYLLAGASTGLISSRAWAETAAEVKVGLLVPVSGMYARPGTVMREGAEMAVEHINAQGGVKALGGARLKLVVLDSGDTTEKAKNAAQRMVAQEPRPGRRERRLSVSRSRWRSPRLPNGPTFPFSPSPIPI